MSWRDGYIAVDWGTTNRRAWRIDAAGAVVGEIEDDRGVTAVSAGAFAAEVADLRARLGDGPMLLGGMIGSDRGWRDAGYATAPVGLPELARAICWIEPGRTGIVPGVCQRGDVGADVMRGEELQSLGAVAAGLVPADAILCLPGTHAKWLVLERGQITRFRTMITGEMFALLSRHSILAAQLKQPVADDADFAEGVAAALAGRDILSGLFRIRAGHLLGGGAANPSSYASGLLIGSDVRAGLANVSRGPVYLVGRDDLCALYDRAITQAGGAAERVDGSAAFRAGIHALTELL